MFSNGTSPSDFSGPCGARNLTNCFSCPTFLFSVLLCGSIMHLKLCLQQGEKSPDLTEN